MIILMYVIWLFRETGQIQDANVAYAIVHELSFEVLVMYAYLMVGLSRLYRFERRR